jgi:peptide/nickel transport system substrate-binding protein
VKQVNAGEFPSQTYEFIGFNFRTPVMKNKLLRHAIARAIDVDALVSKAYLSHAARAYSPVHPASWLHEPGVAIYDYNPPLAGALVTMVRNGETDYEQPDDIIGSTGDDDPMPDTPVEIPVLRVLLNSSNDERVWIANSVAESLALIGIQAIVAALPYGEFAESVARGDFDLLVGGYSFSDDPDYRKMFSSSGISAGTNFLRYSDPVLDEMLDAAYGYGTEDDYAAAIAEAQVRIAEELPVISLAFLDSAVLVSTRVRGEINPVEGNAFANINEWFIIGE